jgi:hypothetical protein
MMKGHQTGDLLGSIDTLEASLAAQESIYF